MTTTAIYYHADCLDGFGAAYAAWRKFGEEAIYRPCHHGDAWLIDEVSDRDVFILDFSFPRDSLERMAGHARSVTLIDHHISARHAWAAELRPLETTGESFRDPVLPLHVHFDMQRSGVHLAWRHFHPSTPLPRILAHIEDIDLWRFLLPNTRAVCRALRLRSWSFNIWDDIIRDSEGTASTTYQQLIHQGEAIEAFLNLEIQRLAGSRLLTRVTLKGEAIDPLQAIRHGLPVIEDNHQTWRAVTGVAINANSLFASELGNVLAELHGGFALIWEMNDQLIAKASLRANGQINVALIAENYGGGGHPNAAGFRLPMPEFLQLLSPK